jgi:hypothetical protein
VFAAGLPLELAHDTFTAVKRRRDDVFGGVSKPAAYHASLGGTVGEPSAFGCHRWFHFALRSVT